MDDIIGKRFLINREDRLVFTVTNIFWDNKKGDFLILTDYKTNGGLFSIYFKDIPNNNWFSNAFNK